MKFSSMIGIGFVGLFTKVLFADAPPVYSYFYECSSNQVDCTAFPKHFNGDFGMEGVVPINYFYNYFGGSSIFYSNYRGEVLGQVEEGPGENPTYGVNGILNCVDGCNDGQFHAVDINESGLALFQNYGWPTLGYGVDGQLSDELLHLDSTLRDTLALRLEVDPCSLGCDTLGGVGEALGLNDKNQVLISLSGRERMIKGVLSPFEIAPNSTTFHHMPEPHSWMLLLSIVLFLIWRVKFY